MSKYCRPKNGNKILSDGIEFNEKIEVKNGNTFDAIRKTRNVNNTDYTVTLGVGIANNEGVSALELIEGGTLKSRLELRRNGTIVNAKTNRQITENPSAWTDATVTSYLSGNVRYAKLGNVVIVNFDDVIVKQDTSSHGTVLVSGLPVSTQYLRTELVPHASGGTPFRIAIDTNGNVINHYCVKTADSSLNFYGYLIYLTN